MNVASFILSFFILNFPVTEYRDFRGCFFINLCINY